MSLIDRVRQALGGEPRIRVHVLLRGRIGSGWLDVDERISLAVDATLGDLIEALEAGGIGVLKALEESPHLRDTLMVNGERRPIDDHRDLVLRDADQVYLLAPIAGG